jgi:hypothetical protein
VKTENRFSPGQNGSKKTADNSGLLSQYGTPPMARRSQLFMLPLSEAKPPGRLTVLLLTLLALYAPFGWILWLPGPWNEKRLLWLKSWAALPGFLVQSLDVFEGRPIWVSYASMALLTLLALIVCFRVGRISRMWLCVSFVLAAAFSGYSSWLALQSF